ncbi:HAD family phosphatase [Sphingomonas sp. C3-2]|uniref:HAD family hydrolase n=1 Tax=Sphingomonas sp. C3-2 TaxID=3062169 RepID=UPI00294B6ADB|nr:HAD family phosphatase [Sphingomonas sp. C3-2]WOK35156.1 HAD family phosphatase [Sphingomonas sp. C3-2]
MSFAGLLFDFDGVLIESEYAGNAHLAETLTALGHPLSTEDAMAHFMGLSGDQFLDAIAAWIGRPVPEAFHAMRAAEDARVVAEGVPPVKGAAAFVGALAPDLPRAIVSSSSTRWIEAHLGHLGLRGSFAHIFSGREHVARGKPAPDIYLHAAQALGIDIANTLIIEDSPVGVTGAVASGGYVVGLCAGQHCAPDHGDKLRALGARHIVHGFDEIAALIG